MSKSHMPALGAPVLAAALLAAGATLVHAQAPQPPIERVTFEQAIARAIEKNPTVAQAATLILRAEALLEQSHAFVRPNVNGTVTNTTLDSARGFSGGVTQPQNQTTIAVDASLPLFAPARWAAIEQQRDQVGVAKASAADVRRQIAVAAAQAYLAVIAQRRQVEVNERARDTALAHVDYAKRRLASGAGTRLNEVRAEQEVSIDEGRTETARLAVRRAQEALGVLLGAGGPVDAADEPRLAAPGALDESAWKTARTDLQLSIAQQRATERIWRDSRKDMLPSVTASFDPQVVTPRGLFQPSLTWRFSVSFSQPIYSGGVQRAAERARHVSFDASTLALTALQIQARAEVRLAQATVQSLERSLASARTAAQQAAEVVTITTAALQAGGTTNIEVIDAQRSARDLETAVAIAEDAVRRARLDLLVALGRFPS